MKLITFTIPSYNSASYMSKCIDSLLACGSEKEIEIIIVNDGSTDDTAAIADRYAADHPQCIRVIHQSNGGHGEGVNQGLRHATGLYFKVVDSDDWLDVESALPLMARMREQAHSVAPIDLFIANYVYEKIHEDKRRPMRFSMVFPEDEIIGWADTRMFGVSQYLLMHTLYYRTEILRQSGLELPKHTFYVDSIFAFVPLPYTKSLCYLNLDIYRYYIGRADQSVSEANMIKRIDQQLLVNRLMIEAHKKEMILTLDEKLQKYMRNYIRIVFAISMSIELLACHDTHFEKNRPNWMLLKKLHPEWYYNIRFRSFVALMNLPGKLGRRINLTSYRLVNKIFKFN